MLSELSLEIDVGNSRRNGSDTSPHNFCSLLYTSALVTVSSVLLCLSTHVLIQSTQINMSRMPSGCQTRGTATTGTKARR